MQAGYKPGDWVKSTTTQPDTPFYESEYSSTDIGFESPQEKHYIQDMPVSDVMYGSNNENALDYISNFPKKIHEGRHGKHIVGHNHYIPGRSIISVSDDEILDLVKQYSGSGDCLGSNKERIDFGEVIGKFVDKKTGRIYDTTVGIIHYSKDGIHVVPARPKGW